MCRKFLPLVLTLCLCLTLLPMTVLGAESDFVIIDGRLAEYNGPGGDVVVPEGVAKIGIPPGFYQEYRSGAYPFAYRTDILSLTFPDSLTDIGMYQFDGCTNLTSFAVSEGNAHLSSEGGVLFDKGKTRLIRFPEGKGGAYTVPDHVTEMDWGVFFCCKKLTNVTFGNGITVIEPDTFNGCTNLTTVTLPNRVTEIGGGAFTGCNSLTDITIPDSVIDIDGSAFSACGLTNITIPSSVTQIGFEAFYHCENLSSVNILESSTVEIGMCAFQECNSLTSVTIPASVTEIGNYAFHTVNINNGGMEPISGLTIYGMSGSYAETYAKENNIPFVSLGYAPATARAGTLTSDSGEIVEWSINRGRQAHRYRESGSRQGCLGGLL